MSMIQVFTTQQASEWTAALERCAPYDFYHLPEYHQLAEEAGDGIARLFVYRKGDHTIALPLLLRCLDSAEFTQLPDGGWCDVTSVYGYPGPICSQREIPADIVVGFQSAFQAQLRELKVVTLFSRVHPFLSPLALLAGLGELRRTQTVSIDLTLPADAQVAQIRKRFRLAINKARRLGLTVVHDRDGVYFADFIQVYHETMHRLQAAAMYFFPSSYFSRLREGLGSRLNLFVCRHEGRTVAGGLFVACHGILQYHLGGTADAALKLAPMKLLMDEVRQWGSTQGLHTFHLGGGTTSDPDDSLLHFKRGFSDRVHDFSTWRWVLLPGLYDRLCATRAEWNERQGLQAANANYFPQYRSPAVPCDSPVLAPVATQPMREAGTVSPGGWL